MPQDASAIEREAFDRVLILGEPHSGKLAPLDEPVLTPHGWSTMGALRVGDHVIGSDGAATKVIGIYPQGVQKIVRVTADDGASTRCGLEHLWLTTTRHELRSGSRRYPPGTPHRLRGIVKQEFIGWGAGTVKTTEEIMETLRAKHYLPRLSKPVRFIDAEARADLVGASLPIEPYFLGLLLGDGSFVEGSSITFTKPDDELLDAVTRGVTVFGDEGVRTGSDEKCAGIRVRGTGTRDALRALRLYGCRAEAKFVPAIYLTALPEARLLMLRGLLDTDGHAQRQCCDDNPEHPNNGRSLLAEFSTTAPGLRDGVVELVRSLGGRAYVRYKPEPKFQDGGVGQPAWSVMITFDDGTCPFALKRKADVWSADREKHYRQRVETIEAAGETECVCIEVDAADGLYVAKDYLLTHNSTSVTASAAEAFGGRAHV